MKTGCAKSLLLSVGLGAIWFALFRLWFPLDEAILGSFVCGFASLMIFSGFQAAFKGWRNTSGLREDGTADMRPGAGAFKDGELVTFAGRIRATGPSLHAPFSQRPCVMYQYDIWRQGGTSTGRQKAFTGFALTPCVIEAPNVSVKLLGLPDLEGFVAEARDGALDLDNAAAYIEATSFEDMQGMAALGKVWGAIKERVSDDDGTVRKDWQMVATKSGDIIDSTLSEQLVVSGDQVVASGVYSAARGGIVSELSKGMNKLVRGDGRTGVPSARGQGIAQLFGGLIFGLVLIAATLGILLARTPNPGSSQLLALVHSFRPAPRITRNSLTAKDAEVRVCNEWLLSIQNEDRSALHRLSATLTRSKLEKVNFAEWKAQRPAQATLLNGTSVGDNAMVMMRGTRPDGTLVHGTYRLERYQGDWRVKDEKWEPATR